MHLIPYTEFTKVLYSQTLIFIDCNITYYKYHFNIIISHVDMIIKLINILLLHVDINNSHVNIIMCCIIYHACRIQKYISFRIHQFNSLILTQINFPQIAYFKYILRLFLEKTKGTHDNRRYIFCFVNFSLFRY